MTLPPVNGVRFTAHQVARFHVQFRAMIRSDVSVYQIFQRFRLGKSEFPGRWTAKPYIPPPTPFPFLSFLTLRFCFLLASGFHPLPLLLSLSSSFNPRRSRFRARISFPLPPFPRKLDSCFQFCAGLRKGSAEQHSFVSFTLSSAPSKLSYPKLPQLFLPYRRPSSSPCRPRIVAKLIRLASSSRPLNRRRATRRDRMPSFVRQQSSVFR